MERPSNIVKAVIPDDLIIEILRRLPANSAALYRCRGVCRQWKEWISIKRHLLTSTCEIVDDVNCIFRYQTMDKAGDIIKKDILEINGILFYCNGFVDACLTRIVLKDDLDLYLFDPAREDLQTLPSKEIQAYDLREVALGYVPSTAKFKVLRSYFDEYKNGVACEVLVPGSCSNWKAVQPPPFLLEDASVYSDGSIYFLAHALRKKEVRIACFNLSEEKWSEIWFRHKYDIRNTRFELKGIKGCLCMVAYTTFWQKKTIVNVWSLTDYAKQCWKNEYRITDASCSLSLVTVWDDGFLLFHDRLKQELYEYNPLSETFTAIATNVYHASVYLEAFVSS